MVHRNRKSQVFALAATVAAFEAKLASILGIPESVPATVFWAYGRSLMKINCSFGFSDARLDPDEGGAEEGDLQVERDVPVPGDGQREEQGQLRLPQPGIHHEGVHQQGKKHRAFGRSENQKLCSRFGSLSTFIWHRSCWFISRLGIWHVKVRENLFISSSALPGIGRLSGTFQPKSRTITCPFPGLVMPVALPGG